jgi:hypothetical protein
MKNIIISIITCLLCLCSCNNYPAKPSPKIEETTHKKEQQLPIPKTKKRVSKGLMNRRNAEIELWKKK